MTTPTTPPTPSTPPTGPDRADSATFSTRMYNMFAWMSGVMMADVVALVGNTYNNALSAWEAAVAAADAAGAAVPAAIAAQASAVSALNAPGTSATSSTSLDIATGPQSLTIQAGKAYSVGQAVTIAYTAAPTTRMSGAVTGYDSGVGTLGVSIDTISGSGTYDAWTVSLGCVALPTASQAEMEAGSEAALRSMSPLLVAQAIASLSGSSVVRSARTSNTNLGAADKSCFIDITSGTFTQTFAAAATLGDGWWCYVGNSGSGFVTLDPNGAETITRDGIAHATWVLWPGEVCVLICNGTGFFYTNMQKGQITQTVSSSVSEVIFATGMSYRPRMTMTIENVSVSTSSYFDVSLRVGGSSRIRQSRLIYAQSASPPLTSSASGITGTDSLVANASDDERLVACLDFFIGTTRNSCFRSSTNFKSGSGNYIHTHGIAFAGQEASPCITSNLGDIRLFPSVGTINTGTFTLREV